MADFTRLSEAEIEASLVDLPDWSRDGDRICASFHFQDFKQAFAFIAHVALTSEVNDHHPDWHNVYNKVSFAFSTHDAGDKITDLDIRMAREISKAAQLFL